MVVRDDDNKLSLTYSWSFRKC